MKIMLATLVLFSAAALAGIAQPHLARSADPAPAGKTITVTGAGSVETIPDHATFSFSVQTNAATAEDALAKNAAAAAAVVTALEGAKVQTSGLSLDRRYDTTGNPIAGYTATTTVTAVGELAKIGGLIDAAVAAGATRLSGPSFSRSDRDALYHSALKDAVADARTKASAIADAGGLTLGEIVSVGEGAPASPVAWAQTAAKIEPGTQTVDATVTVTFAAS